MELENDGFSNNKIYFFFAFDFQVPCVFFQGWSNLIRCHENFGLPNVFIRLAFPRPVSKYEEKLRTIDPTLKARKHWKSHCVLIGLADFDSLQLNIMYILGGGFEY